MTSTIDNSTLPRSVISPATNTHCRGKPLLRRTPPIWLTSMKDDEDWVFLFFILVDDPRQKQWKMGSEINWSIDWQVGQSFAAGTGQLLSYRSMAVYRVLHHRGWDPLLLIICDCMNFVCVLLNWKLKIPFGSNVGTLMWERLKSARDQYECFFTWTEFETCRSLGAFTMEERVLLRSPVR